MNPVRDLKPVENSNSNPSQCLYACLSDPPIRQAGRRVKNILRYPTQPEIILRTYGTLIQLVFDFSTHIESPLGQHLFNAIHPKILHIIFSAKSAKTLLKRMPSVNSRLIFSVKDILIINAKFSSFY